LPAGPIIVLTGTALFLASMLFGVRRGAIARLIQHRQFQREWHLRQFLRTMYELIEAGGFRQLSVSTDTLLARRSWSVSTAARGFQAAVRDGLALASRNGKHGDIELTPAGWREAIEVTRGQRLWEEFLTTYPDQAASVVSLASASLAGQVPDSVVQQLQSQLQAAGRWPAEAAA
jgi:manganese/zinc/iron transport system permease protein